MKNKPEVVIEFFGESGNIFFIEYLAMLSLVEKGKRYINIAKQIPHVVRANAKDYFDAIAIIGRFVELIPAESELQDEYYAKRPENMVDGRFIADLVKAELERRKYGK